jgi:hypothetical protein
MGERRKKKEGVMGVVGVGREGSGRGTDERGAPGGECCLPSPSPLALAASFEGLPSWSCEPPPAADEVNEDRRRAGRARAAGR